MKNFLNVVDMGRTIDEISQPIAYGGLPPRDDLVICNKKDK